MQKFATVMPYIAMSTMTTMSHVFSVTAAKRAFSTYIAGRTPNIPSHLDPTKKHVTVARVYCDKANCGTYICEVRCSVEKFRIWHGHYTSYKTYKLYPEEIKHTAEGGGVIKKTIFVSHRNYLNQGQKQYFVGYVAEDTPYDLITNIYSWETDEEASDYTRQAEVTKKLEGLDWKGKTPGRIVKPPE